MFAQIRTRARIGAVLFMGLLLLVIGCNSQQDPALQQLRITNSGREDIKNLAVLFPGNTANSEAVHVEFGDVPAGTTTGYREVPSGVYAYAAYRYTLAGREVTQPVVDWVGEKPMQGQKFTYRISLDSSQVQGGQITLIGALVEQP